MDANTLQNDVKKVAVGAGVSLFGGLSGKGFFFVSQILIARFLGVEEFGLYTLGYAVIRICDIIARLGLNLGGMRFVSIYKTDSPAKLKGALIAAFLISLLNAVIISIVLYLFSEKIAFWIFNKPEMKDSLKLFSYSLPFVAALTVLSSLLQGFHTMKYPVYTRDIFQPGANIVLIILFYYMNFKLSGVIYAFILSNVLSGLLALYYLGYLFPGIKEKTIKPVYEISNLISYSCPLLFVGVMQYLLSWTDTLMLGMLGSGQDVGIYRAAYQVPFVMAVFLRAANSIYAPVAADLYQKGEIERLSFILKATTRWVTYAIIPLFFLLVLLPKEIMLLFGKDYVESGYLVLIVLGFGQAVNCITGGVGYTLTMTGKQKIELINSIGLVLLSIILNWQLIPKFGALGAAIASATAMILINFIRVIEVYYIYNILSYSKDLVYFIITVCIVGTFGSVIIGIYPLSKYFIITAGTLLIIGTLIIKMLTTNVDRYVFETLLNKVFNRGTK